MTTLILAQKRFLPTCLTAYANRMSEQFLSVNRNGAVSTIMIFFIIAAVVSYLTATYLAFEVGFKIQDQENVISGLTALTASKEVDFRELHTRRLSIYSEELSSMEKISALRYLGKGNGITASLSTMHP